MTKGFQAGTLGHFILECWEKGKNRTKINVCKDTLVSVKQKGHLFVSRVASFEFLGMSRGF